MNYSYTQWKKHLMDEDVHAMAILSFPAVTQCATTVQELVQNAEMQSAVMRRIKEEFPFAGSAGQYDGSVCRGAGIRLSCQLS